MSAPPRAHESACEAPEEPRQWTLLKYAEPGTFVEDPASFFRLDNASLPSPSSLPPDTFLFENLYVSVDPYQRMRIDPRSKRKFTIGEKIASYAVMRVVECPTSTSEGNDGVLQRLQKGAVVMGQGGWSTHHVTKVIEKEHLLTQHGVNVVPDALLKAGVSPSCFIGILGMPGMTAYGGITRILEVKKGDIVVVSAALGAVGSAAAQMAKLKGASLVVGIAGGPEKCRQLTEVLGLDAAVDYKRFTDIKTMRAELLRVTAGKRIDKYFDNTGGHTTAAIWPILNHKARVAICGQIASYNSKEGLMPDFLKLLIYKQITIRGFVCFEWDRDSGFWGSFYEEVGKWVVEKQIVFHETLVEGVEKLPEAFGMLFRRTHRKRGKVVVKV